MPCAPIFRSSSRFDHTDRIDGLGVSQTTREGQQSHLPRDVLQLLANESFLSDEFAGDEFARDPNGSSVAESQCLRPP